VLSFINNEFEGWPILNPNRFVNNKEHTLRKLIKLFRFGVSPLFNMYVTSSPSDPNKAVIKISQASWFLIKDYYDDAEIMRNYKNFAVKFLTIMNSTSLNLEEEVDRMINIEKMLAKVIF
jgi:predicted metalloendopeptidase